MKRDERGIALVFTLFLMATLSALAVSMMFLSQTETAASRNYRTMSQARYAAEAGVNSMANFLMGSTYAAAAPSSPFTGYDTSKWPVTCTTGTAGCSHTTGTTCDGSTIANALSTGCIVVGYSAATTNNPAGTMYTGASGTLGVNSTGTTSNAAAGTVTYGAVAILLAMQSVTPYGGGTDVIQTWQIVSDGTVPPSTAAIVEVSSSLEREFGTAQTFAVFATGTGCGAINLGGTVQTASTSDGTTVVNSGGNVGTNGNMTIGGHVDVHGSLSSPRTGVGSCTDGNTPPALTEGGSASVDGNNLITLPQALTFPTPPAPSPLPPTSTLSSASAVCTAITLENTTNGTSIGCTISGSTAVIDPNGATVTLGNIATPIKLDGGTYNINSIGNDSIATGTSSSGSSAVTINLAGRNSDGSQMADPFSLTSQTIVNPTMNAADLQIVYGGTGNIDMTGGSSAAMLLYAPNASVTTHGNADIYGSLLVASVNAQGTPRFVYDTRLQKTIVTLGNYMMTSFSWKKY